LGATLVADAPDAKSNDSIASYRPAKNLQGDGASGQAFSKRRALRSQNIHSRAFRKAPARRRCPTSWVLSLTEGTARTEKPRAKFADRKLSRAARECDEKENFP